MHHRVLAYGAIGIESHRREKRLALGLVRDLDLDVRDRAPEAHVRAVRAAQDVAVTDRITPDHAAVAEPQAPLVGSDAAALLAPPLRPRLEEADDSWKEDCAREPPERMTRDGVNHREDRERRPDGDERHDRGEEPEPLRPNDHGLAQVLPHEASLAWPAPDQNGSPASARR